MELTASDEATRTAYYPFSTWSDYKGKGYTTAQISLRFTLLDIMRENALEISSLMSRLYDYPPSLNRTLILGALEYVSLAQNKLDKIKLEVGKCFEIVRLIKEYLNMVDQKLKTEKDGFDSIDISDTEDIFKKIENICYVQGILPRINEENVDLSDFYK